MKLIVLILLATTCLAAAPVASAAPLTASAGMVCVDVYPGEIPPVDIYVCSARPQAPNEP